MGNNITVSSDSSLQSIAGFASLQTVGGVISINNNAAQTSLTGFAELTDAGGIDIDTEAALTSVLGFPKLQNVVGVANTPGLTLHDNPALLKIDFFQTRARSPAATSSSTTTVP